jgi:hypothetical protein
LRPRHGTLQPGAGAGEAEGEIHWPGLVSRPAGEPRHRADETLHRQRRGADGGGAGEAQRRGERGRLAGEAGELNDGGRLALGLDDDPAVIHFHRLQRQAVAAGWWRGRGGAAARGRGGAGEIPVRAPGRVALQIELRPFQP